MSENCGSCGNKNSWMGPNRGMCMKRTGVNNGMGNRCNCMENTDVCRRGGCGRRCGETENKADKCVQECRGETERNTCGCVKERNCGEEQRGCGCQTGRDHTHCGNRCQSNGAGGGSLIQPRNQGCMRKSPCDAMGCGKSEKWDPCCIETKPVDEMKLAMGYVPWQKFEQVMCAEQGLAHGTIFEELVLPFYGTACWNERGMKCR